MKKILFVRHGKSSWEYDISDQKRPLSMRGINDVKNMSRLLKSIITEDFDAIYSSSAVRAYDTCRLVLERLNIDIDLVEETDELYDFEGCQVLSLIKSLSDDITSIALFGHNNAFTSLSNLLGSKYIDNLPTAGMVFIKFDIDDWSQIKHGKTIGIATPKLGYQSEK